MNPDTLNNFVKSHRLSDKEVFHNGFHEITPLHLIDSLRTARANIDYSNYDCNNLDRIMELLFRYCEEHKIPLGNHVPETLDLRQWETP